MCKTNPSIQNAIFRDAVVRRNFVVSKGVFLLFLMSLFLFPAALTAQTGSTGQITGNVTDQGGAVGNGVGDLKDGFLVRDGDVAADETKLWHGAQQARKVERRDVDGDIVAFDPVAFQPVGMKRWAAAMGDGMAKDSGKRDAGMVGHVAIMPRLPSHANSGRSGRPRMVKWSPEMAENRRTPSSSTL